MATGAIEPMEHRGLWRRRKPAATSGQRKHTRRLTQEILNEMAVLEQDQRNDLLRMQQERA